MNMKTDAFFRHRFNGLWRKLRRVKGQGCGTLNEVGFELGYHIPY